MNGGRVLLLAAVIVACGGDQRSGAAPPDTAQAPARDTVVSAPSDTAATAGQDTGTAALVRESTLTQTDTAKTIVSRPTPRKPSPKPAAPARPRAPDTATVGTAASDTAALQEPSAPATDPAPAPATAETAASETAPVATEPADSTSPAAEASAPLRDQYHPAPLDTVTQQVYDGWKQYNLNCARCHGEDVLGTTIAPHLLVSVKPNGPVNTKELFIQTVCAGRPAKGMPAWCPLGMEMPTIEAIYAYVKGRSDAELRPGRPALREGG
jgi:mono/diheme cytochrome c family protein